MLDRFPAHWVATIAMGLPAMGLYMLAAVVSSPPVLAGAVALIGLSLGAESDLAAYFVLRYFRVEIYGTVLGLVVTSLALSATLGAVVRSYTLKFVDNFWLYMVVAGVSSVLGSMLFLVLGGQSATAGDGSEASPAPGSQ